MIKEVLQALARINTIARLGLPKGGAVLNWVVFILFSILDHLEGPVAKDDRWMKWPKI